MKPNDPLAVSPDKMALWSRQAIHLNMKSKHGIRNLDLGQWSRSKTGLKKYHQIIEELRNKVRHFAAAGQENAMKSDKIGKDGDHLTPLPYFPQFNQMKELNKQQNILLSYVQFFFLIFLLVYTSCSGRNYRNVLKILKIKLSK